MVVVVVGVDGWKMQLEPSSQAPNWSPWASCYQPAHLPSETAEDQLQLWDEVGGKLKQARQSERPETKRWKRRRGAGGRVAAAALPRLSQVTHGGP